MTFLWDGRELFCCSCHRVTEFLDSGHEYVDATPEMTKRADQLAKLFIKSVRGQDNPHKAALSIELPGREAVNG